MVTVISHPSRRRAAASIPLGLGSGSKQLRLTSDGAAGTALGCKGSSPRKLCAGKRESRLLHADTARQKKRQKVD